jgi:hypothetical protein
MGIEADGLKLEPRRSLMRPAQPVEVAAVRGAMPLQLLIGVAEEVGGKIQLRGYVGLGSWLDERADVSNESSTSAVDQLPDFRQAAVKTEGRH